MYRILILLTYLSSLVFSHVTSDIFENYFYKNKNIMLFINPINGDIVEANNSAVKFYGYRNLTSKNITQINTFTKSQVLEEIQKAKKEQRNYFIFNHLLSNGSIQKVRVFSHPIKFNNKKVLHSTIYPVILEKEFIENFNTTLEEQVVVQSEQLKEKHKITTALLVLSLVGSIFAIIILLVLYRYKVKSQRTIQQQKETIEYEKNSLKIQKDRLELVLEGTGLGLWDWNPQTNEVVFDERWANILGYKHAEITPSLDEWKSRVHPDDLAKCFKDIQRHIIGKSKFYNNIHRMMHKDGRWRYILDRGKITQRDEDGNPTRFTGTHTDITYIKKTERKLEEKQYTIDQYIQLIDKYIITSSTDLDGNITDISDAYCKISGYSKEELIGKKHSINKHPDTNTDVHKEMWETITQDKTWHGEIMNQDRFGKTYWIEGTISPKYNEYGEKVGYTSIRQDITDKKVIEKISITDGLTNVFNRRHFNEIFPKVINSAKRDNELVSFLIIDVDHFKQYNDTYGHQKGDDVLIELTKCIKNTIHRADDNCFRLGGEEFGVIFKAKSKDKANKFANKIRENVENLHIEHSGNSASKYLTISLGLVCKNANEIKDSLELYKNADEQLYKAKEAGRNRTEVLN